MSATVAAGIELHATCAEPEAWQRTDSPRRALRVDLAADALAGVPAAGAAEFAALEAELLGRGLLPAADAAALVERLSMTTAGLSLRPERPRTVVLVLDDAAARLAAELAGTIAEFAFGAQERVITIDVGPITEANMVSGFLGTTQGYIGFGETLPIHELAQKPFSVLRLQHVDSCHAVVRQRLARAIRDGYFTDVAGRRIYLSSAILCLEAARRTTGDRRLGFAMRASPARGRPPSASSESMAAAALGAELAGGCDLVVVPTQGSSADGAASVGGILRRLARRYRAAGIEIEWTPAVEAYLGEGVASLPTGPLVERRVEDEVGRAARRHLATPVRPLGLALDVAAGRLCAEIATPNTRATRESGVP